MNDFLGGQTVTLGRRISEIGKVSTVVFTGFCDQESSDSLMSKLAATKPVITIEIQKSLTYFLVVEIYLRP